MSAWNWHKSSSGTIIHSSLRYLGGDLFHRFYLHYLVHAAMSCGLRNMTLP